jgi:hypothetical protein
MKKLVLLKFLFSSTCLLATENQTQYFAELQTECEYRDLMIFKAHLSGGAYFKSDNLTIVGEVKTLYQLCNDFDNLSLNIEKGYVEYSFTDYLSLMGGRDQLKNMFESEIQYNSFFNGVALNCDYTYFGVKAATFIPGFDGYYAGCVQVQVKPFDLPILLAFSETYWTSDTDGIEDYRIAQLSGKYSPRNAILGLPLTVSAGWLVNDQANTDGTGFYAGLEIGNPYPQNKHEWNVATIFKKIGKNAIPDVDQNGFSDFSRDSGVSLESTYAVSDHIALKGKAALLWDEKNVHDFSQQYSLSAICKF